MNEIVSSTTTELALPDPAVVTLAQVRTDLVPVVRAIRERIQEARDIGAARELARRLEAFRRYLTDREGRDLLAAETRRTEVLIGQLLGPAPEAGTDYGRSRPIESPASDLKIPKDDRRRFRLLAEHADAVEEALSAGVVSRKALLERIQYKPSGEPSVLLPGQCSTIVADPPWRYGNTSTRGAAQDHYNTLTIEQLCGTEPLPDGRYLTKDIIIPKTAGQAHLYLWATAGHLPRAFDVMEAWGFTYKTYLVWVKPQMGMGNYFRVSTELVLFGVKGDMRTLKPAQSIKNYFEARRLKHSAKPRDLREIVKKASPGPYWELFARCRRNELVVGCECSHCEDGWEVWGNQA